MVFGDKYFFISNSVVASGNPQVCSDLCVCKVLYVCECTCACVFSYSTCVCVCVLQTVLVQMCLCVFMYFEALSMCQEFHSKITIQHFQKFM